MASIIWDKLWTLPLDHNSVRMQLAAQVHGSVQAVRTVGISQVNNANNTSNADLAIFPCQNDAKRLLRFYTGCLRLWSSRSLCPLLIKINVLFMSQIISCKLCEPCVNIFSLTWYNIQWRGFAKKKSSAYGPSKRCVCLHVQ